MLQIRKKKPCPSNLRDEVRNRKVLTIYTLPNNLLLLLSAHPCQAGINLNIFAAISGIFGSKTQKETKADGSSTEHTQSAGRMKGAGAGNLSAMGEANAETTDRRLRANASPRTVEGQAHQTIEDSK